jgi:predicted enzyme related to lactoylglutathione lyase
MRAEELGAEIVALRVGKADGPGAAGALLRASPRSRLLVADRQPLTAERTQAWFDAGVAVLGAGPEALGVDPAGGAAAVAGAPDAVRAAIARVRGWVRRARGEKLFQSVEHVGLYEHRDANASDIIRKVWDEAWYRDTFEWDVEEGRAYYFVAGDGPGRIEIMKVGKTDRCHLAIKVADLDEATAYLKTKGIDLVPPETRPDGRRIFFTVTDPAGNILHMLP